MKVKNFFVYNNISILWQLIECGLQIFHHCTLHLYKTKHYIFIREISNFNPLFIKPFYHFSPNILWVMTRCNKAHEGFIHFSRKRTCQIWYKSNFEQKSISYQTSVEQFVLKITGFFIQDSAKRQSVNLLLF